VVKIPVRARLAPLGVVSGAGSFRRLATRMFVSSLWMTSRWAAWPIRQQTTAQSFEFKTGGGHWGLPNQAQDKCRWEVIEFGVLTVQARINRVELGARARRLTKSG